VPLNRLHENVLWSMRGNFFDLPTDCPQRDERLGWTGDIQVFAPTASFLYDTSGFLASWLKDVAAEQREAGDNVPVVVPNTIPGPTLIAAAWSDAAVIVPWVQYQRFGDREILAAQFESMCAWVDRIVELAGPSRLWDQGFQFGDWLDPRAPATRPEEALTNRHLVATAYFAYSADLVSQAAGVLGLTDAESRYHKLAEEVRAAFANEYITPSGRLLSDAQTAYALAFEFGLIPTAEQRKRAADRLLDLVRASGYHIETGFVGTPLICDALCTIGKDAAAYRLLLQEECPSWLYPVTMGATTIWERWDSMLPDGSINPGEMTSFNHYALGAVADWMHRVVGGLAPAAPGYRRMTIQPRPGDGLTHASARHITPYGLAECAWKIHDGVIDVQVTVPPNTTASVVLPGSGQNAIEIGSGTYTWSYAYQQEVTHTPLTIDHPVGEIVDDVRAWSVIVETLQALDPENPVAASRLYSQNTTLRQGLMMMPHSERMIAGVDAALTRLAQSAG
jgi:alpha-L-rhamnosidase